MPEPNDIDLTIQPIDEANLLDLREYCEAKLAYLRQQGRDEDKMQYWKPIVEKIKNYEGAVSVVNELMGLAPDLS